MRQKEIDSLAERVLEQMHRDYSEDQIKAHMANKGIPFKKVASAYRRAAVKAGLVREPKEVTQDILALLAKVKFNKRTVKEWPDVEELRDNITDHVKGATKERVLTLIRQHCREIGFTVPDKSSRSKGVRGPRGSKVTAVIADLFISIPEPTKQQFYNQVAEVVTGDHPHRNAMYYTNLYFPMCYAVKHGISLPNALDAVKDQPDPVEPD